jgi:hypothetical protein
MEINCENIHKYCLPIDYDINIFISTCFFGKFQQSYDRVFIKPKERRWNPHLLFSLYIQCFWFAVIIHQPNRFRNYFKYNEIRIIRTLDPFLHPWVPVFFF